MKQESKLVTHMAGSVKSMVDYIAVLQGDKAKVRNVKVIPIEECVPVVCMLCIYLSVISQWMLHTNVRCVVGLKGHIQQFGCGNKSHR